MTTYTENIDAAQFFPSDVIKAAKAVAANFNSITLKNWMEKRSKDGGAIILMSEHDRRAAGAGRPALFTFRRVMQVAITAALVETGIAAGRAGTLALGFTDVGDGVAYWGGERQPPFERLPGELYRDGGTLLVAYPGEDTSHIMKVTGKTTLFSLARGGNEIFGASFVLLNNIDQNVRAALGLPLDWAKQR